jgi:predicted lipid-binding transport protein (Tim44 family)
VTEARAALVLALFVGGIASGVVLQRVTDSNERTNPYPSLDRVEEPAQSAKVAAALANNDARTLANLLDNQTLSDLREALMSPMGAPMADIRNVKFVGATAKQGRVLAGYVVSGKDMQGSDAIVGVVLDVENGEIVGVN